MRKQNGVWVQMDTLGRGHHLSEGLRHVTAWCIWRCRGGERLQAIEYGWNIAFKEEHGCNRRTRANWTYLAGSRESLKQKKDMVDEFRSVSLVAEWWMDPKQVRGKAWRPVRRLLQCLGKR